MNVKNRNRISAKASRDKKKAYIRELEKSQKDLIEEKRQLIIRIDVLLKEVDGVE